jgi:hypothetical protein
LTAEHLIDGEGNGLPIGTLNVEEDEVLDSELLTEVDPEEDFEGYTGNAGMTLDRWYRHAAIVLWPESRHFEILCDRDSRTIVPVLKQLVAKCRRSNAKDAAILKAQSLDLARAILAKWTENPYGSVDPKEPGESELFKALTALDDPELIGRFLGDVMVKDVAVDPGESLVAACQRHGWGPFGRNS